MDKLSALQHPYSVNTGQRMRISCWSKAMTSQAARTNHSVELPLSRLDCFVWFFFCFAFPFARWTSGPMWREKWWKWRGKILLEQNSLLWWKQYSYCIAAPGRLVALLVVTSVPVWPVHTTAIIKPRQLWAVFWICLGVFCYIPHIFFIEFRLFFPCLQPTGVNTGVG